MVINGSRERAKDDLRLNCAAVAPRKPAALRRTNMVGRRSGRTGLRRRFDGGPRRWALVAARPSSCPYLMQVTLPTETRFADPVRTDEFIDVALHDEPALISGDGDQVPHLRPRRRSTALW